MREPYFGVGQHAGHSREGLRAALSSGKPHTEARQEGGAHVRRAHAHQQSGASLGPRHAPARAAVTGTPLAGALDLAQRIRDRVAPGKAEVDALEALIERAKQPLRLAVVGRLNAGKSTLVNALLGQTVAHTDPAEATRYVTEYEFGFPERVLVHLRSGDVSTVPLDFDARGTAMLDLDASPADVSFVRVRMSNAVLREMTLIDTPGLASLTAEVAARTRELMALEGASHAGASRADAVIAILSPGIRADDAAALASFRSLFTGFSGSSVNAIAVLGKADTVEGEGRDSMLVAGEMADRYRSTSAVRALACNVLPVAGLIAETVESGLLTEADTRDLAALADMPGDQREVLLMGADLFRTAEAPVSRPARARLLDLLGMYGVRRAVSMLREGERGATALTTALRDLSGISALRTELDSRFRRRVNVLKADAALSGLERLMADRPEFDVRDEVESLRMDPAMHELMEIHALNLLGGGRHDLPDELHEDLVRLLTEGSTERRLGTWGATEGPMMVAAQGAARWNAFRSGGRASPTGARLADIAVRTYTLLYEDLEQRERDAGTAGVRR